MLDNSSSSSSSSSLAFLDPRHCLNNTLILSISIAFTATRAFLIAPPTLLVLYLGYQRCRQQRSFTAATHSDIITYHLAAMELVWLLGAAVSFADMTFQSREIAAVNLILSDVTYYGETFFHLLTCAERYLAVVHPVTYLALRKARGVRIRNASIGCVWLVSCGWAVLSALLEPETISLQFCLFLVFSLVLVSFCSLSVLCILIRPGPGEGGRDKERVDQSKKKAVSTILVISGVLWVWFLGYILCICLSSLPLLSPEVDCMLVLAVLWFSLPSSLVLPVLYLHRAGKLPRKRCVFYFNRVTR